ncbi:MAG: chromosome segregation protein SMC [Deltaproteobacteria bacterium]|nr:chromosome segregation protein SMC [Deltaproteobacteria bacterium]
MRIKRLEIQGFKSFADRTVVHFSDGITGIVGPNGCGKSNIVDALRWAMGERSAKHLRGASMEDVIFSGSDSRGPLGFAEVTVTFKNDGALVPPEYQSVAEISVTRRLFRDGTSEYLINRTKCRLKDVEDLFLGTGVGTKSYSVIEQGRIGLVVTAKPENRRELIEDAAGVTKYKVRRRQAEARLEASEQNLLRVTDILAELDKRMSGLERQAKRAEQYKVLKAELKTLDLEAAVHQFLELTVRQRFVTFEGDLARAELVEREAQVVTEDEKLRAAVEALDADREKLRTEEASLSELEQKLAVGIATAEHTDRALIGLKERTVETEAEHDRVRETFEARSTERTTLAASHASIATVTIEERQRLEAETGELVRTEDLIAKSEAQLERSQRILVECLTNVAQHESNLENLAKSRDDLEGRRQRLLAEKESIEQKLADLDQLARDTRTRLDENRQLKLALIEAKSSKEQALEKLQGQLVDKEAELLALREELMDKRSRLSSLEEIQRNYEGCEGGVRSIMKRSKAEGSFLDRVHGLVADVITSEPRLETAIEAVLGERLQYVIVRDQEEGVRSVEYLRRSQEGRSSFIPLDVRRTHVSWAPKSARSKVPVAVAAGAGEVRGGIEIRGAALSPILVDAVSKPVASTSELPISDRPPPSELVREAQRLTVEAARGRTEDVVLPMGASPLGASTLPVPELVEDSEDVWPDLSAPGVLGRMLDLIQTPPGFEQIAYVLLGDVVVVEDLQRAKEIWAEGLHRKTIVTLEGDVLDPVGILTGGSSTGVTAGMLAKKREIKELERVVASLQKRLATVEASHKTLAKKISDLEDSIRSLRDEGHREDLTLVTVEKDLRSLEENGARHVERRVVVEREIEQVVESMNAVEAERERSRIAIEKLEERRGELTKSASSDTQTLSEAKARKILATERVTQLKVSVAQRTEQHEAARQNLDRLDAELTELATRLVRLDEVVRTSKSEITRLAEALVTAREGGQGIRERIDVQKAVIEELKKRLGSGSENVRAEDERLRAARKAIESLKDTLGARILDAKELAMARDTLESQIEERYQLELAAQVSDWHMAKLHGPEEDERRGRLRKKLDAMGEINLTAIAEFQEVQARHKFLDEQKQDLEAAIADLKTAIRRINKTSHERYMETFKLVNEKLQVVFPRLFGGGVASLEITGGADPLEAGVEMMIQPPGKKLQSASLMSGGEKALTAIALIFSIFLIKPTPFCLLDEVDAPLDDANVGRYNDLVKDMSSISQFILITHNKRTMEVPDRLYGVTMEEPGISKLVGVDLKAAEAAVGNVEPALTHES